MSYKQLVHAACQRLNLSAEETAIVWRYAPKENKRGHYQATRCYLAILGGVK